MIDFPYLPDIIERTPSKIVMVVVDGLGGLPHPKTGKSELQTAHTPNLDRLAQRSDTGLTVPVLPGIAPGSGPGHLALFGYDPTKHVIGRGVLEGLGIGADLREGDVAARGNFCIVDDTGCILDRRAGRISTSESAPLCEMLNRIEMPGVELSVQSVRDYRFVLILRGAGLDPAIVGTDPGRVGMEPQQATATNSDARWTAEVINSFVGRANQRLQDNERANMVLLRGWSQLPDLPPFGDAYRLTPGAIAAYPMYRGLAQTVGMQIISSGSTFTDEVKTIGTALEDHDFLYVHYKAADATGEDGDFDGKVEALEKFDEHIPAILEAKPDVLVIAGDHATPSVLAAHSWHPVPVLIHSQWTGNNGVPHFDEQACSNGTLGRIPAVQLMLLVLAHAGKLNKFGP
jgi:2,3-bisphosphoglycerate-independent phosphoglycerate mutase